MIKLTKEPRSMHQPAKITPELLSLSVSRRPHAMPTPEKPMIIHQSELANFLRCRVKWHLRHQLRLVRKGGAKNLEMGTMYHGIHEAFYSLPFKQRTIEKMTKLAKTLAWAETYLDENRKTKSYTVLEAEERELIQSMAINWSGWVRDENNAYNDRAIGLVECFPEMEFDHPLTKDGSIRIRGRFDLPFKPTVFKNAMSCCETKTRSSFRDEYLEQSIQLSTYIWAMRKSWPGMKRYSIWFQRSRKQMPTPRVRTPLHDRVEIERTPEQIHQWEIDTQHQVMDMLGASIYPSPMDSCNFSCDYKGPCALRGDPADVKHVLKHEYEYKPEDER